jgi:chromosome segregation protein
MYLKSIRAYGFKSFADKTEIDLKPGITGIVGPNGSGKSNIVDAIRWVLGEQSVKALRGDNGMNDIIFSGSKTRDQASRAAVSLVFDNTDHYLNSDFKELEIKRVIYRNTENEYYINNIKVRLKDITDLFLDSGAGKASFNIISQGTVTDIINNKPNDRRAIFEEAAGVLKYKKRKEETNRKLDYANNNLDKIGLLITELNKELEPLKAQSIIAKKYLSYQDELKNTEISLIACDITKMNQEYSNIKSNVASLKEELSNIDLSNNSDLAKIEQLKLTNVKLNEEINQATENMINLEHLLADLEIKKQLTIERQKYEVDDAKLTSNLINLKEEELTLNKNITTLNNEIATVNNNMATLINKKNELDDTILRSTHDHYAIEGLINNKNKDIMELKNKMDILTNNIDNNDLIPSAVRVILSNPRFTGIHGILGKLMTMDDKYAIAINTSLGANQNVIVVDNPNNAKECINYLKDNRFGRATFFPINVIKGRNIDSSTLKLINELDGFINIASNLVNYDVKYQNIMENQLGNIIIVDNIDTMNKIGKLIDYKYRIVTLTGEVLYAGGAITGGIYKKDLGIINEKLELSKLQKELNGYNEEVKSYALKYNNILKLEQEQNKDLQTKQAEIINLTEVLNQKNIALTDLKKQYNLKIQEINGINNLKNNALNDEMNQILTEYYNKNAEKDILEQKLNDLKSKRDNINTEIATYEENNHHLNSDYNQKQNNLKDLEIKLGKMDVRMDNYLVTLNETYNMTYEKALEIADLKIDVSKSMENVAKLKNNIKALGEVNIGSIAEFDRVNERYNFLIKQQTDLQSSIAELQQIISEMDSIMIDKFTTTFKNIATNFGEVFKSLFKGGLGKLELTDANDILNTGIEIIAQPPGKKLNSIGLLSGGEKTLTAIALLFAILNVKPVPFVVLDEVEAALDEPNVDAFGTFLQNKASNSQFIIITHKKKTMEYANTLYGITMQESGVSKLVSVKLAD